MKPEENIAGRLHMNNELLLAYYLGARGHTIRIDVQSKGDLIAIRQLFHRLTLEAGVEADFAGALRCTLDGIRTLIVRSVRRQPSKALLLHNSTGKGPVFAWSNTTDGWQDCMEKVEGLVGHDAPAHHYLTIEGEDDALVELCYREESPVHPRIAG